MNFVDTTIDFVFNNIFIFVILGVVVFVLYQYVSFTRRTKIRILKRSDIERQNMERRLENNPTTTFKWLYHPNPKLIGKITHLRTISQMLPDTEGEPSDKYFKQYTVWSKNKKQKIKKKEYKFLQLAVKPILIHRLKITNPLAKKIIFQVLDDATIIKNEKNKSIVIPEEIGFDYNMGIDYSMGITNILEGHRNLIIEEMLRTEFDLQASRYFVKSQEQCVYDPDKAHQLAMKEKELQIELAKRRGKMTTI